MVKTFLRFLGMGLMIMPGGYFLITSYECQYSGCNNSSTNGLIIYVLIGIILFVSTFSKKIFPEKKDKNDEN